MSEEKCTMVQGVTNRNVCFLVGRIDDLVIDSFLVAAATIGIYTRYPIIMELEKGCQKTSYNNNIGENLWKIENINVCEQ